MNELLAKKIIDILTREGGMKYVSLFAGVVKTLQTTEAGVNNERHIVRRVPVASYFKTEKAGDYSQLTTVPDSSESVIVYFEDNGSTASEKYLSNGAQSWNCRLDLVCWINTKKLSESEATSLSIISEIIKGLGSAKRNEECFIGLDLKVKAIKPKDANIFSKYSYDEKVNQYLMPPYDYFSISIDASSYVNEKCILNLMLNDKEKC